MWGQHCASCGVSNGIRAKLGKRLCESCEREGRYVHEADPEGYVDGWSPAQCAPLTVQIGTSDFTFTPYFQGKWSCSICERDAQQREVRWMHPDWGFDSPAKAADAAIGYVARAVTGHLG